MDDEPPAELDPPDGVVEADSAVEVLRAWVADGALLVSLNSSAFGDQTAEWGRLLAEIGHHLARSAALNGYMQEAEARTTIRDAFATSFEAMLSGTSGRLKGQLKH
jgi:hypothetical protein